MYLDQLKMLCSVMLVMLAAGVAMSSAPNQVSQAPRLIVLEASKANKLIAPVAHRPEAYKNRPPEPSNSGFVNSPKPQPIAMQPTFREGIRVTINDNSARYAKLERFLAVLDRVAYAISKPVAIMNALRFVSFAVSSLAMSAFIGQSDDGYVESTGHRLGGRLKKKRRERGLKHNPFLQVTRADMEGMIDLMTQNYDETLNKAELDDRSACRERSFCVLGDMMACDFPNLVVVAGKFAHNYLPPLDTHRNKYSKALMLGLNQTDCDRAYRSNDYDCPTFREYVKSYFIGGARRRRDNHHRWWRQ